MTTPANALDLEELERLLGEAMDLPWSVYQSDPRRDGYRTFCSILGAPGSAPDGKAELVIGELSGTERDKNADLLVAAVNALPALVRIARAAQRAELAHRAVLDLPNIVGHATHQEMAEVAHVLDEREAAMRNLGVEIRSAGLLKETEHE